jgi:hypothetical protein
MGKYVDSMASGFKEQQFLGALAKLQKATISSVVRLSAWMINITSWLLTPEEQT